MSQITNRETSTVRLRSESNSPSDIGSMLLAVFVGIVAIINLAIIILIATDVSLYFSIALSIFDLTLVAAMFQLKRTSLVVASIVMGMMLALGLAVWLSQSSIPEPPMFDEPVDVVRPEIEALQSDAVQ